MTYYVMQFADFFFVIRRVRGYSGRMIFKGTKVSTEEYQKLFYSNADRKVTKGNANYDMVQIKGIASEVIGREVETVR